MRYRLFDKKGELKNLDSKDGSYSKKELDDTKKYVEPNGKKFNVKRVRRKK